MGTCSIEKKGIINIYAPFYMVTLILVFMLYIHNMGATRLLISDYSLMYIHAYLFYHVLE